MAQENNALVKVKPLEWVFWTQGDYAGADAHSAVGLYQIRSKPKEGIHKLFLGTDLICEGDYTDLKPAAQTDYEARIRSVLEPDPRASALVEAVQAFKDFDDMPTSHKRPDVFELRVRRRLLAALAALDTTGGKADG